MFLEWSKDFIKRYSGSAKRYELNLGELGLSNDKVSNDFTLADKYQAFSAELIRISLIGLGVSAYFFKDGFNDVKTKSFISLVMNSPDLKRLFYWSILSFAVSASFALFYRYFSSDALAFQLRYLRLKMLDQDDAIKKRLENINTALKKEEKENITEEKLREYIFDQTNLERWKRNIILKICSWTLILATLALVVGAVLLALTLLQIISSTK